MVNFKVYLSDSFDPRINLSLEEYFMKNVKADERILLFWQSENAVVIGVNQNPYQECNLVKTEEDNVIIVRRLSGGGAVYHDLGNLNFAFISENKNFNIDDNFRIILNALKKLSVDGEFNGRNDLISLGRKFSGNAFIHDGEAHLHHGTLLLNTDVSKISNYLTVSHKKLDNKGFDSIESRVINLSEINPNIMVKTVIESTIDVLKAEHNFHSYQIINPDETIAGIFLTKYMSHQWNFGECAAFDIQIEEKFEWGLVSLEMNIDSGKIHDISLRTDALEFNLFMQLNEVLKDIELTENTINKAIKLLTHDSIIEEDLIYLFKKHIFS